VIHRLPDGLVGKVLLVLYAEGSLRRRFPREQHPHRPEERVLAVEHIGWASIGADVGDQPELAEQLELVLDGAWGERRATRDLAQVQCRTARLAGGEVKCLEHQSPSFPRRSMSELSMRIVLIVRTLHQYS